MPYQSSYTGAQIDERLGQAHKQGKVVEGTGIKVSKTTTDGVITSVVAIDPDVVASQTDVTNAIKALDVTDSVQTAQFVTAVSETDGKISVSRSNVSAVVGNDLTFNTSTNKIDVDESKIATVSAMNTALVTKADTSYVDTELGKKQNTLTAGSNITITGATIAATVPTKVSDLTNDSKFQTDTQVSASITAAVGALDKADTAVAGKYVSAVSEVDGVITVTRADLPSSVDAYTKAETDALLADKADADDVPTKVSELTNDSKFQTDTQVSTTVSTEIGKLDVTDTAVSGKYVSAVSESDGKISVTRADLPTVPTKTSDLTNDSGFITSADVPTKVSELTNDAGYLTEHQSLANYTTKTYVDTEVGKKQDKLTAGANITIGTDGKISATDTTYTAGAGISITGNVISSVASAPEFSEILGDPTDNTKLATALDAKADASDVYTKTEADAKFRTETQVSTAITTEIQKLDKADTAVAGKYVSQVSETDGVITVTRADLPVYIGDSTRYIQVDSSNKIGLTDQLMNDLEETAEALTDISGRLSTAESTLGYKADISDVPTKVSDLTNDSKFQTDTEVSTAITTALSGLDIDAGDASWISGITQTDGKITSIVFGAPETLGAFSGTFSDSSLLVAGDGVSPYKPKKITGSALWSWISGKLPASGTAWGSITGTLSNQTDLKSALDAKQNKLTAINGLFCETNGEIGVKLGQGLTLDVDGKLAVVPAGTVWGGIGGDINDQNDLKWALEDKQDVLVAGTGISIAADGKTISATDTTYTAGTNVQISAGNVISATDTTYTAGTNVQISSGNVISATDTTYTAATDGALVLSGDNQFDLSDEAKMLLTMGAGSAYTFTAGDNIVLDEVYPSIETPAPGSLTISAPLAVTTCAPTATAESQVLKIVRVTELPADPDPTTLYVVI